MKKLLSGLLLAALLSGCVKLATTTISTAGDICCTAIKTTGHVAAATVKAAGQVLSTGIENPDGASLAATMVP